MPEDAVRIRDLIGRGDTYPEARRAVAGLTRIGQGTYADLVGLTAETEHLVRARSLLARVGHVAVSHLTAALASGLPTPTGPLGPVHLSPLEGRPGNPKSGPGYHLHFEAIPAASTAMVSGVLATTPDLTVLHCARVLPLDWAVVIADAALHRGLVDPDALATAANRTRRVRGAARVRALPDLVSALAESPGESLLRLRLRHMGFAVDEQVVLAEVPGRPRVDFLVEGTLVVEFDGRSKYRIEGDPEAAHWSEKLRHDRIVECGYPVLRAIWPDLWDQPRLRTRVERALGRPSGWR